MSHVSGRVGQTILAVWLSSAVLVHAAVPAEEAAKLKSDLTPLGAERAGNKEGTIPPWDTNATSGIKGLDPFKDDKPLFSINAKNMAQYEGRLSDGIQAMLKKYPETFRLDVYRTRRTAVAPQYVYDNTLRNATRAKLVNSMPENAFGGIPFPIPKTGEEVIWNHQLRWRGTSLQFPTSTFQITSDGKPVLISDLSVMEQYPYYFSDLPIEQFSRTNTFYKTRIFTTAPAIRAGEQLVGSATFDINTSEAYVYLTGQRRVRKLPNPCCDTPSPTTGGLMSIDEIYGFTGPTDRFDWKIVGKQEMFIPYNSNRFLFSKGEAEALVGGHPNPAFLRWELHRVWAVEATLRAGKRHQAARGRYYCDEDTWTCVLVDRWDAKGQLWKSIWMAPMFSADVPGVMTTVFGFNDMLSGSGFIIGVNRANSKPAWIEAKPRWPDGYFTGEAMAAEGVR